MFSYNLNQNCKHFFCGIVIIWNIWNNAILLLLHCISNCNTKFKASLIPMGKMNNHSLKNYFYKREDDLSNEVENSLNWAH